ncbi:MAG: hypothetical protein V1916_01345 [Patescibacteria group bacterium]
MPSVLIVETGRGDLGRTIVGRGAEVTVADDWESAIKACFHWFDRSALPSAVIVDTDDDHDERGRILCDIHHLLGDYGIARQVLLVAYTSQVPELVELLRTHRTQRQLRTVDDYVRLRQVQLVRYPELDLTSAYVLVLAKPVQVRELTQLMALLGAAAN